MMDAMTCQSPITFELKDATPLDKKNPQKTFFRNQILCGEKKFLKDICVLSAQFYVKIHQERFDVILWAK